MGLIARNGRMAGPTDDGWFPVACWRRADTPRRSGSAAEL